MVRLKDEAQYIEPALESIAPWCDEIVIAFQGEQTDGTEQIVKRWASERENVSLHWYPFDSLPNGPGHGDQTAGSVHERAYFYNWTLAATACTHVIKWDGDMVAHDHAGALLRELMSENASVCFGGVDIVDDMQIGERARCASEPRLFRVTAGTYYKTGPMCEVLVGGGDPCNVAEPLFLHFKWAKDPKSARKAWPDNWREMEHFRVINSRAVALSEYVGPVPSVLSV